MKLRGLRLASRTGSCSLLRRPARMSRVQAGMFAGAMAVVGVVVVLAIFASGTPNAFEAESGTLAGCASTVSDSNASGSSAVKFSACGSGSLTDPTNLDASGQTIPDTNYAVPSGAIFMATTGSDSNGGTQAAPVKTLDKAIALVPDNGTIVVHGGTDASPAVYRDMYTGGQGNFKYKISSKGFTLQAYPHEKPGLTAATCRRHPVGRATATATGTWIGTPRSSATGLTMISRITNNRKPAT